jgi:hypothetical protein
MAKKIIKMSTSAIDKLINEELKRHSKIQKLKNELAIINEEIEQVKKECDINEVEVSGRKDGEQWYQKGMPTPKFDEKKASGAKDAVHLKEDEFGEEMETETFEQKLAAIGRELDAKLALTGDEEEIELPEPEEEVEVDAEEEIEIPADEEDEAPVDDIEIEDDTEKEEDSEEEMIDEKKYEENEKKDDEKDEKDIITGEEEKNLNEGRKVGSKSASEVLQEAERARMKKLAGI